MTEPDQKEKLDSDAVNRAVRRIAHEIVERNRGVEHVEAKKGLSAKVYLDAFMQN